MVKMILCCDMIGNIGKNNDLLFKMKEDMKFFKQMTTNNIVIMGYNTWLSLGEKPLPNRVNIVMTDKTIKNIQTETDLLKVINDYRKYPQDIYIIGGAFVYNQALELDLIDEILITIVPIIVKDADVSVKYDLINKFDKKEIIKTFINEEGIEVKIFKYSKYKANENKIKNIENNIGFPPFGDEFDYYRWN